MATYSRTRSILDVDSLCPQRLLLRALHAAALFVATAGIAVVVGPPLLDWLPEVDRPREVIGYLLGAQASLAALTLAVALFALQGVSARRDADNRIYRRYVTRSWVLLLSFLSLCAVAASGAMLLAAPRVNDPTIVAGAAFVESLLLGAALTCANSPPGATGRVGEAAARGKRARRSRRRASVPRPTAAHCCGRRDR